jgi:hypothetical protein
MLHNVNNSKKSLNNGRINKFHEEKRLRKMCCMRWAYTFLFTFIFFWEILIEFLCLCIVGGVMEERCTKLGAKRKLFPGTFEEKKIILPNKTWPWLWKGTKRLKLNDTGIWSTTDPVGSFKRQISFKFVSFESVFIKLWSTGHRGSSAVHSLYRKKKHCKNYIRQLMKNTLIHVCAKTVFVGWPSTANRRISSFPNFLSHNHYFRKCFKLVYRNSVVMLTWTTGIMFLLFTCTPFGVWGILRRWSAIAENVRNTDLNARL